jgi:5'-methylthioadenosine phosphorylase
MKIGIIGGSGLYDIEGFENRQWKKVETPFGAPSDEYLTGTLSGREVVFLPRHGRGHRILPSELNHRANIWGMKSLGVEWIISASAVGSLQHKYRPLDIVIPDQFFDRTKQSAAHTFFGNGIVAHIGFSHPFCETLRKVAFGAAREALSASAKGRKPVKSKGKTIPPPKAHFGGTYVNMEGPAFSTLAESNAHRKLGFDLIGMTNLGEAKCAREAEIHYATLALVTDYDCWHPHHDAVTVEMVIGYLTQNAANAKQIIKTVVARIPDDQTLLSCKCHQALKHAIMTDRKIWNEQTKKHLEPILRKYL